MTAHVEVSTPHDGVAQLLLDSGGRNFLTWELNERLLEQLVRLREDDAVRVVVLGSAVEGTFVSHGDLTDVAATFSGGTPSGDATAGLRVQRELDTGPLVSIAAVDGPGAAARSLRGRATYASPRAVPPSDSRRC